jgi:hypothetical protein
MAYTTKSMLFRVEFEFLCEFDKSNIVIRSIIEYKEPDIVGGNTKGFKERENYSCLIYRDILALVFLVVICVPFLVFPCPGNSGMLIRRLTATLLEFIKYTTTPTKDIFSCFDP